MSKTRLGLILFAAGLLIGWLLNAPRVSQETWRTSFPWPIDMPPTAANDYAIIVGSSCRQLVLLGEDGKWREGPKGFSQLCQPPMTMSQGQMVIIDNAGVLQAFAGQDLQPKWKQQILPASFSAGSGSPTGPMVLAANRLLVTIASATIAILDGENGSTIWQRDLPGRISSLAPSENVVSCIHEAAGATPSRRISAFTLENGNPLWSLQVPVDERPAFITSGRLAVCDVPGRPLIIDQNSGTVTYRHSSEGLRIAGFFAKALFLLAAGGSRIECHHIEGGAMWSTALPSPLQLVHEQDGKVLIVDGRGVRTLNEANGEPLWQREFSHIVEAWINQGRLAITWKESLQSSDFYCTTIDIRTGTPLWACRDRGLFWPPIRLKGHDLVVCRNGCTRNMADESAGAR